jgi:enoyl-CoA hydratase/carnithine racemase
VIGRARDVEMLLANRWLNGEEAFRFGLVNRVVPRDKLFETAEEMARKIASYHPLAVRNAKAAIVRGMDLPLSEGLDLEKRLASELSQRRAQELNVRKGDK